MSEPTNLKTPYVDYAAALLKKLIDPTASDPMAEDFARLKGDLLQIALAVLSEGRGKDARRNRLRQELNSREGLSALMFIIEAADARADLSAIGTGNEWQFFDLAEVREETIPPTDWIVKYFLPCPSVVIFYGRPKHKKSLVALDLCHHIASGLNWMTSAPNGKDGIAVTGARVVWIDLENGSRVLKRRMQAFDAALEVKAPPGRFHAISMPDPWPDLSKSENEAAMIERVNALGDARVLVFDHLAMIFGDVDENSPLAGQIMAALRRIAEACNLAIILLHHATKGIGKDGGMLEDKLRGSGAILAGCDAAYMVEKNLAEPNQIIVRPVAVRGPDAPNISANFSFEQNENLDLTSARFWRVAYKSMAARANEAILAALRANKKLNFTELRAVAKVNDSGVTDGALREAIKILEGTKEIIYTAGAKGAKIYRLGESDDEDQ